MGQVLVPRTPISNSQDNLIEEQIPVPKTQIIETPKNNKRIRVKPKKLFDKKGSTVTIRQEERVIENIINENI